MRPVFVEAGRSGVSRGSGAHDVLILTVINGPSAGRVYEVADDRSEILGRDAPLLRLKDSRVSRHHAVVRVENGQWVLEDLGASNGTYINRKRIGTPVGLRSGDRLHIGRIKLVVSKAEVTQDAEVGPARPTPRQDAEARVEPMVEVEAAGETGEWQTTGDDEAGSLVTGDQAVGEDEAIQSPVVDPSQARTQAEAEAEAEAEAVVSDDVQLDTELPGSLAARPAAKSLASDELDDDDVLSLLGDPLGEATRLTLEEEAEEERPHAEEPARATAAVGGGGPPGGVTDAVTAEAEAEAEEGPVVAEAVREATRSVVDGLMPMRLEGGDDAAPPVAVEAAEGQPVEGVVDPEAADAVDAADVALPDRREQVEAVEAIAASNARPSEEADRSEGIEGIEGLEGFDLHESVEAAALEAWDDAGQAEEPVEEEDDDTFDLLAAALSAYEAGQAVAPDNDAEVSLEPAARLEDHAHQDEEATITDAAPPSATDIAAIAVPDAEVGGLVGELPDEDAALPDAGALEREQEEPETQPATLVSPVEGVSQTRNADADAEETPPADAEAAGGVKTRGVAAQAEAPGDAWDELETLDELTAAWPDEADEPDRADESEVAAVADRTTSADAAPESVILPEAVSEVGVEIDADDAGDNDAEGWPSAAVAHEAAPTGDATDDEQGEARSAVASAGDIEPTPPAPEVPTDEAEADESPSTQPERSRPGDALSRFDEELADLDEVEPASVAVLPERRATRAAIEAEEREHPLYTPRRRSSRGGRRRWIGGLTLVLVLLATAAALAMFGDRILPTGITGPVADAEQQQPITLADATDRPRPPSGAVGPWYPKADPTPTASPTADTLPSHHIPPPAAAPSAFESLLVPLRLRSASTAAPAADRIRTLLDPPPSRPDASTPPPSTRDDPTPLADPRTPGDPVRGDQPISSPPPAVASVPAVPPATTPDHAALDEALDEPNQRAAMAGVSAAGVPVKTLAAAHTDDTAPGEEPPPSRVISRSPASTPDITVSDWNATPRPSGEPAAAVEARKIAFLIDASGSMIDTLPESIDHVIAAIEEGQGISEFTVIFFRGDDAIEVPPAGLKPLNRTGTRKAVRWMQDAAVSASGRSDAGKALQTAMTYGVDEVVILSDGSFGRRSGNKGDTADAAVRQVESALNPAGQKVKLSTVQFFYDDPDAVLQRLAQRHGGSFRLIRSTAAQSRPDAPAVGIDG